MVVAALTMAAHGPTSSSPARLGGVAPDLGPARILEQLADLRAGLDAGGRRAAESERRLYLGACLAGGGRLRCARARAVRPAADACLGPPRAARRLSLQKHPGMGRAARRRHGRAGAGCRRRPAADGGHTAVRLGAGHALRHVHIAGERAQPAPADPVFPVGQAHLHRIGGARSGAGAVAGHRCPPCSGGRAILRHLERRGGAGAAASRAGAAKPGRQRRRGARHGRAAAGRPAHFGRTGKGTLSRAFRATDPVASHGGDPRRRRRPAQRPGEDPRRGGLRVRAERAGANEPVLPGRAVAASPPRLGGTAEPKAGGPVREPDGLARRALGSGRLQSQLPQRLARPGRRGHACHAARRAPGCRRRRVEIPVAAIFGLRRGDPRPSPATGRDPLRAGGIHQAAERIRRSAARSMPISGTAWRCAVPRSIVVRRSILAWSWST